MKKPSKKQIKFAEQIARTLNKELPKEKTSYIYWKFIKDNVDKYNEARNYDIYEEMSEVFPYDWFC